MQLTSLLTTLLATTALAAPAPELETRDFNLMVAGSTWTIQNFKRVCTANAKKCSFTYAIDTNDGKPVTKCSYQATGSPAAHASYSNVKCGAFTVGSTWSNQFGNDKAFTTLSVVKNGQIIYPAYTDKQLAGNKVVKPDQSYTPQNLPS
ncbi:uncharacterized protein LTR77_008906 [Saxophila tyrrhenica]|uniref:Small secreted protein n=1 Tax=Saxophila tyrrhenica TaxID=1690608 RepID=A0AAV9P354_9PEZI|nr:hypothetical protein LTR77_008906 [Saxophila tyrrhenica]